MEALKKLIEKKKKDGKELDPMYKDSKMSMLKALRSEMSGMMKDDLQGGGMKKVEVAGSDEDALKDGLEKAQDMVSGDDSEGVDMGGFGGEHSDKAPDMDELMAQYKADPSQENLEALMECLEKQKSASVTE